MGTYTTNYQLYTPSVGETGWGTLVNGNFTTIDSTMKGLSNRITAVENEVNGNLSCTSVTTSGKITGNGGIAGTTGTFTGNITAANVGLLGIPYQLTLTNSVINNSGWSINYYKKDVNINSYAGGSMFDNAIPLTGGASTTLTVAYNIEDNTNWYISKINIKNGSWLFQLKAINVKAVVNGITVNANSTVNITQAQALAILSKPINVTLTNTGSNNAYGDVEFYIKNNSGSAQYAFCTPIGLTP